MQHAAFGGTWWDDVGRGVPALVAPGLLGALVLYWALAWKTRWNADAVGWPTTRRAAAGLAGLAWGGGLAAATLAISVLGGARLVVEAGDAEAFVPIAMTVGLGLAAAALLEELLFRGFPLARLAEAAGPTGASILLAIGFVVAHLGNPAVSVIGLANIGLASLLLSAVFFSRGGLAAAWGVHLGWNAGLALGADAPVSGLRFGLPALEYFPGRREWLAGGPFGPEGGLAASAVLVAALLWWVMTARKNPEDATA